MVFKNKTQNCLFFPIPYAFWCTEREALVLGVTGASSIGVGLVGVLRMYGRFPLITVFLKTLGWPMVFGLTSCVSGIEAYVFSNEKSHYWSTTVLLMWCGRTQMHLSREAASKHHLANSVLWYGHYTHIQSTLSPRNTSQNYWCHQKWMQQQQHKREHNCKKLSVLDALHILAGSWNKGTKETVCNCWRKANFFLLQRNRIWNSRHPFRFLKVLQKNYLKSGLT